MRFLGRFTHGLMGFRAFDKMSAVFMVFTQLIFIVTTEADVFTAHGECFAVGFWLVAILGMFIVDFWR